MNANCWEKNRTRTDKLDSDRFFFSLLGVINFDDKKCIYRKKAIEISTFFESSRPITIPNSKFLL